MTKTQRKAAASADEAFNRHYAAIWGEGRWRESLYPALLRPTRYACVLNRYTLLSEGLKQVQDDCEKTVPLLLSEKATELQPNTFTQVTSESTESTISTQIMFPPPAPSSSGLLTHWNLDAASVLVAHLLDVQPGDNVLDLCAAPGGKSVVIAQQIWPHLYADDGSLKQRASQSASLRSGTLHSNEADGPRQRRLAENLKAYLPKTLFDTGRVSTLRVDGSKPNAAYELRVKTSTGTTSYDKVLVDAPCSSERHIIHAHARTAPSGRVADEMANWRPGSSKRLASTQLDLLMTGLKAVKIGGTVLYATCSIEPVENDGVIEKMLVQVEKERKKTGIRWKVTVGFEGTQSEEELEKELERNWAERTKHGWIVLPDHPSVGGWGPLFFAMLKKVEG